MPRPTIVFGEQSAWSRLRPLRWVAPLLLVLFATFTTYYTVQSEEVGVVLRFGRFHSIEQPGLHFKLPFGIDDVTTVPVLRQLKLEFGFGTPDRTNPDQVSSAEEQARERSMVTGDTNAVLVEWVVQYRIDDPKLYLFHVREPTRTLRDLSEAVMREVIGDRTVDEVITTGRQDIETTAEARLGELAKTYQLGLGITQVILMNINPPQPVQSSFNEVNKAQQDRENMINVANGESNKILPKARGEAAQKVSEAEGYLLKRVNEALGDANAFTAVLTEYLKAPEVTRKRIYLETMKDVLPQMQNAWIVDERVTQLLPMLQAGAAAKEGGK